VTKISLKFIRRTKMKKIIALALVLNATTAFAFFGDNNGGTNGAFVNNGNADVIGNATGEGEATFGMTFEGTGSTQGQLTGNGNTNGAFAGSADDVRDNGRANGWGDAASNARGNGDASGSAKFSFNFSGRAKSAGDFRGNGNLDSNNNVYGYTQPYYYQTAPVAK
jgi:hypothetical protein